MNIHIDWHELHKLYVLEQKSSYQIAEMYGCAATTIRNKLIECGIKKEDREQHNQLNDLQKDLVIGSMLGDGHLQKKNNLTLMTVSHCENQKEYADAKFKTIKNLCNFEDLYFVDRSKEKDSKNRQNQFQFTTKSMSCLNEYFKLSISETLERININSFTIWMMDDGHHNYPKGKNKNSFYELSISRFSDEEAEYTKEILRKKFIVYPKIKQAQRWNKTDKKLVFSVYDSYRLSYLMKNGDFGELIKETMDYKLIHKVFLNRVVWPEKFTVPIEVG